MQIGYYVSIVRGKQFRLLLGPYDTHDEALDNLERGRRAALDYDQKTWFDAFGTCKLERENNLPAGIFGC